MKPVEIVYYLTPTGMREGVPADESLLAELSTKALLVIKDFSVANPDANFEGGLLQPLCHGGDLDVANFAKYCRQVEREHFQLQAVKSHTLTFSKGRIHEVRIFVVFGKAGESRKFAWSNFASPAKSMLRRLFARGSRSTPDVASAPVQQAATAAAERRQAIVERIAELSVQGGRHVDWSEFGPFLDDTDPLVRGLAMDAMDQYWHPHFRPLLEALHCRSSDVRVWAATRLEGIKDWKTITSAHDSRFAEIQEAHSALFTSMESEQDAEVWKAMMMVFVEIQKVLDRCKR